ncbi:MAG: 50S ribosomal protein L22 [Dehalococcoidia bacterium]
MEVKATAKGIRVSPKKARQIIDTIRGKGADEALAMLKYTPTPTAGKVARVIKSAVANAENNYQMVPSELKITQAHVDEGLRMRRMRFAGRGRIHPYYRRSSHITVVVEEM